MIRTTAGAEAPEAPNPGLRDRLRAAGEFYASAWRLMRAALTGTGMSDRGDAEGISR
jgi:hypothetical protein